MPSRRLRPAFCATTTRPRQEQHPADEQHARGGRALVAGGRAAAAAVTLGPALPAGRVHGHPAAGPRSPRTDWGVSAQRKR